LKPAFCQSKNNACAMRTGLIKRLDGIFAR
jgi:hypothetical protein